MLKPWETEKIVSPFLRKNYFFSNCASAVSFSSGSNTFHGLHPIVVLDIFFQAFETAHLDYVDVTLTEHFEMFIHESPDLMIEWHQVTHFFIDNSIFHMSLELLTQFWKTILKVA